MRGRVGEEAGADLVGANRGTDTGDRLLEAYRLLLAAFGPQGWWPAEGDFEMAVGAILTQSTAWVNVEKAIANLKEAGLMSPEGIEGASLDQLARLVVPSGYFNAKARKLKSLSRFLFEQHGGSLASLFHVKLPEIREQLLSVWGIGPETADSIILYGAHQPVFVVDAYTRRTFSRLGFCPPDAGYHELQGLFADHLEPDVPLFQEYHALIVVHGKGICRPTPLCPRCPLLDLCPYGLARTGPDASGGYSPE